MMALPDADLALLASFIPFGPARITLLAKYFGGAAAVWAASTAKLRETGLSAKLVAGFDSYRTRTDKRTFFADLAKAKITFTTVGSDTYPANLVGLDGAPTVLFVRGHLSPNDAQAIAIVGTRKLTSYGREVTQLFASELAGYGVTIVSGLAFGVDVIAHESALAVGGRCIAVLGSGIDDITPRTNAWLGAKIIKSGGAIVSEFPPGTAVQKAFFPHRNRIISGLSKAVLVVEGAQASGTLHTARHASVQGKEVFAVPGQITSPMSAAPHYLIKHGAKFAFSPADLVEELDMQLKVDKAAVEQILPSNKQEGNIASALKQEPLHLDELARILGLPVAQVSTTLTVMELKGMVKQAGGKYTLRK